MLNQLTTFTAPTGGEIRSLLISGQPHFVAKDVAKALGYDGAEKAVRTHVDSDDKGVSVLDTPGGKQQMTVLNESGLYSLILASKLPAAKQFKRWVTSEVLPAIRRSGGYMVERDETPEETMARALRIAHETLERQKARLTAQENEIAAQQTTIATQQQELTAAQPKVTFADAVADSSSTCLIGELAKLLRQNGVAMGQNRLFAWLREHKYLMSNNMPTQKSAEKGLFRVVKRAVVQPNGSTLAVHTTKVTGKGQQYFVNLFLAQNENH